MVDDQSQTLPSDEVLGRLQELVLSAALASRSLPGLDRPLRLPDIAFVLRGPAILLSNENLAGSPAPEGLPLPLRILSPEAVQEEARAQGDLAYLRFQPPMVRDDTVSLTLEGRIAPQSAAHPLGLGGVRVVFREDAGEWRAVDEPLSFAL